MRLRAIKIVFIFMVPFSISLFAGPISFRDVTAHRGDQDTYRGNSLSALLASMDFVSTSVQFGVHLTKDLVPVIYHDYKLKPIDFEGLTVPVLIKDLTLEEIQNLKYSQRLNTLASDRNIVTLKEFLSGVRDREMQGLPTVPLYLEIKSEKNHLHESASIEDLALEISDVLKRNFVQTPIIARAFNWEVLREFKKHQPEVPLVLLVGKGEWAKTDFGSAINEFKPLAFAPHFSDLTPETIQYLADRNIEVNPWTVNSLDVANKLVSMGVAGITTNHPRLFLKRYQDLISKHGCMQFYSN